MDTEFDEEIARRFGAYASFPETEAGPVAVEYFGESPLAEADR